jgi:hypothetical protein
MSNKRYIYLLLLALFTQQSYQSLFNYASTKGARRIAQDSFGGYVIVKGTPPSLCDGYSSADISISESEFTEGMKKLKSFVYIRSGIDAYVKTGSETEIKSKAVNIAFTLATSFVFMIISLIFFILFIVFYLCRCCRNFCRCCQGKRESKGLEDNPNDPPQVREQKKTKRSKNIRELEKNTTPGKKKCIAWCSVILVVVIGGLGIAWVVTMFKAISGVKKSTCSVHHTFENIKEGVKTDEIQFGGLSGMKYMMTQLKDALATGINQADLDAITNADLTTKATAAYDALGPFSTAEQVKTTTSCTGGAPVKPDHVESLTPEINAAIGTEFNSMKTKGAELMKAADTGSKSIGAEKA